MKAVSSFIEFLAWCGGFMLFKKGLDGISPSAVSSSANLHHWWFWPSWFGGAAEGYLMLAGAIGVFATLFRLSPQGKRFITWFRGGRNE